MSLDVEGMESLFLDDAKRNLGGQPVKITYLILIDDELSGTMSIREEIWALDAPFENEMRQSAWILPELRGQGIGQRITELFLDLVFTEHRVQSIAATTLVENDAAIGLLKKSKYLDLGEVRMPGIDPGARDYLYRCFVIDRSIWFA